MKHVNRAWCDTAFETRYPWPIRYGCIGQRLGVLDDGPHCASAADVHERVRTDLVGRV